MISADQYASSACGNLPAQEMMSVPSYTHVVSRVPVIYETTHVETNYIQVPVQHKFEQRDYPQQQQAQCPMQQAPPCAAPPPPPPCGGTGGSASFARYGW